VFEYEGKRIKLVDLPGTYSLSPYTQEEIITRDYLVHEPPDVIIDVVDATNTERPLSDGSDPGVGGPSCHGTEYL
jgi:ferrous iron transport protein B